MDMVYRLAWRGNYCHSRGIPKLKQAAEQEEEDEP